MLLSPMNEWRWVVLCGGVLRMGLMVLVMMTVRSASGQEADSTGVVVHGYGFSFVVKEPIGWVGDVEQAPKYHSNIIFYPVGKDPENDALVQVALFHKQDEHTERDLAADVDQYEDEHGALRQEDLPVTHQSYPVHSKLVFVKRGFYQYIAYVNPGEDHRQGLSVTMNVLGREATESELQAYRAIVGSLWMVEE